MYYTLPHKAPNIIHLRNRVLRSTEDALPFQDIWVIICEVTATNKLWDFNCFCNG